MQQPVVNQTWSIIYCPQSRTCMQQDATKVSHRLR